MSIKQIASVYFATVFLMNSVLFGAGNSPIAPDISIISPQNNTATNLPSIDIAVSFKATANPNSSDKSTGNVSLLILKINGVEVVRYENPPNIKEDSHTFSIDISGYPDSIISLQAFAYQGNIMQVWLVNLILSNLL